MRTVAGATITNGDGVIFFNFAATDPRNVRVVHPDFKSPRLTS
jgi:hypothetical protein